MQISNTALEWDNIEDITDPIDLCYIIGEDSSNLVYFLIVVQRIADDGFVQ